MLHALAYIGVICKVQHSLHRFTDSGRVDAAQQLIQQLSISNLGLYHWHFEQLRNIAMAMHEIVEDNHPKAVLLENAHGM